MNEFKQGVVVALALCFFALRAHASQDNYTKPQLWRDYAGVSWDGSDKPSANSANAPIAGIHFDKRGRAFVSTPRFIVSNLPSTLNLLDTTPTTGPAHLKAFPSANDNDPYGSPSKNLRSVLGFYVDRTNGWVWVLDMGFVAGESEAPAGGQKIVVYETSTGKVVKRISLDSVADRKASYLNDIAVDERRRIAYIADSGVRGGDPGIIVADFGSGAVRRVLDKNPSVSPEPGVKLVAHGFDVLPGSPLKVGINGIALSSDAEILFWTVTTGQGAYAIPTRSLRYPRANEESISSAVVKLGDVGGNTDGIVVDKEGRIYITDITRNGIVEYSPDTKVMALIASDDAFHWPDTITVAPEGDLVFTSSALNEHFMGLIKAGQEHYQLWRMKKAIDNTLNK